MFVMMEFVKEISESNFGDRLDDFHIMVLSLPNWNIPSAKSMTIISGNQSSKIAYQQAT